MPTEAVSKKIAFVTLGCAKNEVDSQKMGEVLTNAGYQLTSDLDNADAIIVNTCCFIQPATTQSIDAIFEVADMPNVSNGKVPLIVAGCMPSRYGSSLASELSEASALIPCADEENIVEVVNKCLELGERTECGVHPELPSDISELLSEYITDPRENKSFAYVKISDGCDRRCSYCAIPDIRGSYHSFSYESIKLEVEHQIQNGAKEIILIAQDTGRWGEDLDEPKSLAWLIEALAKSFPETWIRVLYIQPEKITHELLHVIAENKNVCDYLDIPLQHVVKRVLRDMNRAGSRESFEKLIEDVKSHVPSIALRTTLIAGFPGETYDDFEELLDFASCGYFDYIGVFPYSREEGTPSYSLPNQLDEEEKAWRARKLQEVADAACSARIAERAGEKLDVLVEGIEEDGQLFGRSMLQAPEVDGITFIDSGNIGSIGKYKIIDTLFYDMEGEAVEQVS